VGKKKGERERCGRRVRKPFFNRGGSASDLGGENMGELLRIERRKKVVLLFPKGGGGKTEYFREEVGKGGCGRTMA